MLSVVPFTTFTMFGTVNVRWRYVTMFFHMAVTPKKTVVGCKAHSSIMSLRTMFALRSLSRAALFRYTAAAQFHATSNCSGAKVAVVSNVMYAGAAHDCH